MWSKNSIYRVSSSKSQIWLVGLYRITNYFTFVFCVYSRNVIPTVIFHTERQLKTLYGWFKLYLIVKYCMHRQKFTLDYCTCHETLLFQCILETFECFMEVLTKLTPILMILERCLILCAFSVIMNDSENKISQNLTFLCEIVIGFWVGVISRIFTKRSNSLMSLELIY